MYVLITLSGNKIFSIYILFLLLVIKARLYLSLRTLFFKRFIISISIIKNDSPLLPIDKSIYALLSLIVYRFVFLFVLSFIKKLFAAIIAFSVVS